VNKNQHIVILIGIIFVLICGLFPPYLGNISNKYKQKRAKNIGNVDLIFCFFIHDLQFNIKVADE